MFDKAGTSPSCWGVNRQHWSIVYKMYLLVVGFAEEPYAGVVMAAANIKFECVAHFIALDFHLIEYRVAAKDVVVVVFKQGNAHVLYAVVRVPFYMHDRLVAVIKQAFAITVFVG